MNWGRNGSDLIFYYYTSICSTAALRRFAGGKSLAQAGTAMPGRWHPARSRITPQSAPSGRPRSRRPIPNNAAHCLGTLSSRLLGRNEFALRQGFTCGKTLVRRKHRPTCGGAPRRATGKAFSVHRLDNYTSICSIRKASITSPSLMSWNFSKVMPHS